MSNQHPTPPKSKYYGVILKMGVALYERSRGFPTWALIFHSKRFSADDVRIYRVVNDSKNWFSDFRICALKEVGPLVGVLRVARIRVPSLEILDMFMSCFPPGAKENNSSFEAIWSSSSWVIRAMEHFKNEVRLPCRNGDHLSTYMRGRIIDLKMRPLPGPGRVRVIPLNDDEKENAMPSSSSSRVIPRIPSVLRTFAKKDRELKGKPPVRKPIM